MGLIHLPGRFVYQTSCDDLPQAVTGSTKERVLNFLGTAHYIYIRKELIISLGRSYEEVN